jgi:hypothetical protein
MGIDGMRLRSLLGGGLLVLLVPAIAGCSSSPSAQVTTTTVAASSTPPSNTVSPTTSSQAHNLAVSDQVRTQLVDAGAALNNIPASEYTGLASGFTYYAFDDATGTYWAGARLVPAPSANPANPTQAQVASQDAGSYYLFRQPQGGAWVAYAAGNTGPDTPCPVTVPAEVLRVWGWPAGSCRPIGA